MALRLRKAVGPDGINAEVLRAGGEAMVIALQSLMAKIWFTEHWPQQWRGGKIKELHKKGPVEQTDNYRGVLLSCHMGKIAAKLLGRQLDEKIISGLPETQCGGVPRRSTDTAHHMVRLAVDYATANKLSMAIIFVDAVKAFDKVLREPAFGWMDNETRTEGVQKLVSKGLSIRHAEAIADMIEQQDLLQKVGVDSKAKNLLKSMHKDPGLVVHGGRWKR